MTKTNYAGTNAESFRQYVDFLWSWSWSVSENFSPGGTTCDSPGVTRLWKDSCQWVSCDRTCCSGQFEENLQKHMYRVESFKHMLFLNIWWWLSPWIILGWGLFNIFENRVLEDLLKPVGWINWLWMMIDANFYTQCASPDHLHWSIDLMETIGNDYNSLLFS